MIAPPFIFRSFAGILLLYSIVRALEVFDFETDYLIQNMEEAQVIANEKERMARDLHDGALQEVYASGLLAQSLKRHISPNLQQEADRLIDTIHQAISQLREYFTSNHARFKIRGFGGSFDSQNRRSTQVHPN